MTSIEPSTLSVVHLAHTGERGGAELALARLLSSKYRRWDASLVMPVGEAGVFEDSAPHLELLEQVGAPQAPGASAAGLVGMFSFAWGVLRQALDVRRTKSFRAADVVHANSTRASLYAALSTLGTKKRLIVHLRDRMEPDAIGKLGHLAFTTIVMRRAHGFIANSESTAEVVSSRLRSDQFIEVAPSPYGVQRVNKAPEETERRLRIGMVARLDPWKGQNLLIEAYARAALDQQAELVLIGDAAFGHSDYERDLRLLVENLELKNVHFTGFEHDVQAAVDSLDICVQYSIRPEPLGQNVLQYLARGKVAVVAGEGGPLEWVDHERNGIVVKPRDVDALSSSLQRVVGSESLRKRIRDAVVADPSIPSEEDILLAHEQAFRRAAGNAS
ncbi:glycosyltransferase family 4 protein [Microbacterium nanhaiense]|uniref:glycosyltransferase family 4 protein n=1 Tax=Microbacterium nanhaiense TaxID=1301026 RepID=UPI00166C4EA9|nr:glycosyltransferase family 4 protein [Microbacterium nanhaiense]